MVRLETSRDGRTKSITLANFNARITADVMIDEGEEQNREFKLEIELGSSRVSFSVTAAEFCRMGWVTDKLGPEAIVYPGQQQHVRAAIQALSGRIRKERIIAHMGWEKQGQEWIYLHEAGALGAAGLVSEIKVRLPHALREYCLAHCDTSASVNAVRASLQCLSVGPDRVTVPLLAAVYRAPLGNAEFSLFLTGKSGVFKSSLAALCQQHFGAAMDASHLPTNFASTPAAVQWFAAQARDALLVVDDFAPTGRSCDSQLHNLSESIFRAAGNQQGRKRMAGNGQLSPSMPSRALILATGEAVAPGSSIRARQLILEMKPGDVDRKMLSVCQRSGKEGDLSAAMAAFVMWMAGRYEELQQQMHVRVQELRIQYSDRDAHARLPSALAELQFGWETFLKFAVEIKAIDVLESEQLVKRGTKAFAELGLLQAKFQENNDPALRFLTLLRSALSRGYAHVANRKGEAPEDAARWGWQRSPTGRRWKHQGSRIGWVSDSDLFLEPVSSDHVARQMAGSPGLAISAQSLRHQLRERGFLVDTDRCRQMLTVRRTLENRPRKVLHLKATDLVPSHHPGETDSLK